MFGRIWDAAGALIAAALLIAVIRDDRRPERGEG
jgi:hypothetical protein